MRSNQWLLSFPFCFVLHKRKVAAPAATSIAEAVHENRGDSLRMPSWNREPFGLGLVTVVLSYIAVVAPPAAVSHEVLKVLCMQ